MIDWNGRSASAEDGALPEAGSCRPGKEGGVALVVTVPAGLRRRRGRPGREPPGCGHGRGRRRRGSGRGIRRRSRPRARRAAGTIPGT